MNGRLLAWISALAYLGMGLVFLFWLPDWLLGVRYVNANALNGSRTMVSGLCLAMGAMGTYLVLQKQYRTAIVLGLFGMLGLAASRFYGMIVDNAWGIDQLIHFTLELIVSLLTLIYLELVRAGKKH
jgi:hypothetical protein